MNVLEKILEEIEERFEYLRKADDACRIYAESDRNFEGMKYFQNLMFATDRAKSIVEEIIHSHMDECKDTNVHSNDSWIPVEERLPEEGTMVIGCDDGKMLIGRACIAMDGSITVDDGAWETLWDVRAWMSVPELYKPKKNIPVAGMDHIMSRFTKVE